MRHTQFFWLAFIFLVTDLPLHGQVRTHQDGTFLYLDNGIVKVGLETTCGATVAQVVLNGVEIVNRFDCGREIQVAFYDGNQQYDNCAGCTGVWGWNPVQGGDKHSHGSPILEKILGPDFIYTKIQPYEWLPDNKGGGPTQGVLSDVLIEQTVSFVPIESTAVRLHYKITHVGQDRHASALQEFPAVYVNLGFDRFVYYGGLKPWTNDSVTSTTMPLNGQEPQTRLLQLERWGAFVNQADTGLAIFVPGQYPYGAGWRFTGTTGPTGSGTNYFMPTLCFFAWEPGITLEGDIYLIAGDHRQARNIIYALKQTVGLQDLFPPFGYVDIPRNNEMVTVPFSVAGWAMDDTRVSRIEVFVDDTLVGHGTYGLSRPDVPAVFPSAPPNTGYQFTVTKRLSQGPHMLAVKAIDDSGHVAVLNPISGVNITVPTSVDRLSEMPTDFWLEQNFPNPFNAGTSIRFSLPLPSHCTIKIYNELGQLVSVLLDEWKTPGMYALNWNPSDKSSGVYWYRMQAGQFAETKKLLLLR